jgi:hypothetical protein
MPERQGNEPASPPTEMRMLMDDIQVCISIARRQEHEAMQRSIRDAWLEKKTLSPAKLKHWPAETHEQTGFQKILLAESAESLRLKAKISGQWNQNFPLSSNAQSH